MAAKINIVVILSTAGEAVAGAALPGPASLRRAAHPQHLISHFDSLPSRSLALLVTLTADFLYSISFFIQNVC